MVRTLLLILLLLCGFTQPSSARDGDLLVLYPEAKIPYQKVYEQIIEGIRSSTQDNLKTLALTQDYDPNRLRHWLDDNKGSADALIVLGSRTLKSVESSEYHLPLIAGAVDLLPGKDQTPGVSIRINPSEYFERLHLLSPRSTRVIVFINEQDKALVPLIETEAHKRDISITPIPVHDASDAIRRITAVFKASDSANTAIWFTRNVIELNTELLYPYVLEESWNRRIPVFSGMISHTKRGFLFSLYPDYYGMGEALGRLVEARAHGNGILNTGFCPAVKFALNTRTAQHLGLKHDEMTLKQVDLTFPAWQTTD
jgi:putative tryptophan/tyrosine transport system substrate-binding protein